jgi:hypothetical protein
VRRKAATVLAFDKARREHIMTSGSDRHTSSDDGNPASDLKTDVIKDVERDDTITSDFVGPRGDETRDDASGDAGEE